MSSPVEFMAARCEEQPAGYLEQARAAGLAIISGDFIVEGIHLPTGRRLPAACCALGAMELYSVARPEGSEPVPLGPSLALPTSLNGVPEGEAFSWAWDAIERGFDGEHVRLSPEPVQPWHRVGVRLRLRFRPVPASSLRGAR